VSVAPDPRSRRVAVVADALLDPLLPELRARGYGAIQLPPADLEPEVASEWREQAAEHAAEFLRHGYEVVLADDGTNEPELNEYLAPLGVDRLPPAPFGPPG
jgi:hypothetical protein